MERHVSSRYVRRLYAAHVRSCRTIFTPSGGEVPRLVAVEGDVAADGR